MQEKQTVALFQGTRFLQLMVGAFSSEGTLLHPIVNIFVIMFVINVEKT
jgi:hypothetical protein